MTKNDINYFVLLLFLTFRSNFSIAQKNSNFSGELTYKIERVDKKDSTKAYMIIYAKDSLIKIVNFNSKNGKQELLRHLRLNKSYILKETKKQNFAIRTSGQLENDTVVNYSFRKKKGVKKIAGIPVKKLLVKHKDIADELTFYYAKNIAAKYANVYKDLPGLPLLYYIPTEDGLHRYTLLELKNTDPPLELFMIPKNYKILSFEEFIIEFSLLTNDEDR